MIAEYFRLETAKLRDACLADIHSADDWNAKKGEYRRQLLDMLGLDPLPERTELQPVVTGKAEHDEFVVERLHFQSRPGLYVTGDLYVPKNLKKGEKLPAILYVCGHGGVKKDGVSFGNKTHYQHHGGWFARNGYVCLIIDSLQLGEIEGIHHGTHRYDRWWWLSRGYTPAGVEAWNCVRALDYLQSRPEVDGDKLGVTGRSGGGAYSWWIAAIDERIKAAVPTAGITDLQNHVVDGCVEGHCDCMFCLNTYRWDYPLVAALVAPRPLLISNTDRDGIFPLDGVYRTYSKVRRLYELLGKPNDVALQITAGGHADTQELHIHAFRWFDKHLKGIDRPIDKPAVKFFQPEQLKVFDNLPADELNTKIDETFVAAAPTPVPPADKAAWEKQRDGCLQQLGDKVFRGWPVSGSPLELTEAFNVEADGVRLRAFDFVSQQGITLRLYVAQRAKLDKAELVVVNPLDAAGWTEFLATYRPAFAEQLKAEAPDSESQAAGEWQSTKKMFESFPWTMAYVAPRGIGPTAWDQSAKKQTQHRRRFYLLGQTLEEMQAWDIRRAIQATRSVSGLGDTPLWLQGHRQMAALSVYAAIFEPNIKRIDLHEMPTSHRDGPALFNVLRVFDLPQAVTLAAERSQVVIYSPEKNAWQFPQAVAERLQWEKRFQLRTPPQPKATE
ncbi:MAG: prolyl oligopeptidase family serine peptidase [Planctomycetaceae bacterium]|nr:prolyl oligopeptidase family serine peptidase [Planctomycetaceae bacterium]